MIASLEGLAWIETPQSSNVVQWHYDEKTHELLVEFKPRKDGTRSVYVHTPIASAFADRLREPGVSVGKLIHELRFDKTISVEPVEIVNPSSLPQQSADAPELHTEVS